MGVWEITFLANRYARRDSKYLEMYLTAAAAYWIITIISSWFQSRLETRLRKLMNAEPIIRIIGLHKWFGMLHV